jgi:hypothetical protein
MTMRYDGPGKSTTLAMEMGDDGARLLTGSGRQIGRVARTDHGDVEVFAGGRLLARYDAEQVADLTETWRQGGSTAVASWAARRVETPDAAHAARFPRLR